MALTEKSLFKSADEAYKLVSEVVIELADEKMNDPRINENVAGKLGFVDFEVTTKNGIIKTKLGIEGATPVDEFDSFNVRKDKYGKDISYDVIRYFEGCGMSSEAKKWIEAAQKDNNIPQALRQDIANSLNKAEDRLYAISIAENEYLTKIITKGFDAPSATFWPGSPVYDGKRLFDKTHAIIGTGGTQSNVVTKNDGTPDATKYGKLNFTNLLAAVDQIRMMKDGNGVRIRRADMYTLVVSPAQEKLATDILSNENGFMPYTYTGADAGNGNYDNVFTRGGFKVKLVVLDTIGQPDTEDPSAVVGSDTMWFVVNTEYNSVRKAMRKLTLGGLTPDMFEDEHTRAVWLTVEKHFGAQALYYEGIVGSKGDESTI